MTDPDDRIAETSDQERPDAEVFEDGTPEAPNGAEPEAVPSEEPTEDPAAGSDEESPAGGDDAAGEPRRGSAPLLDASDLGRAVEAILFVVEAPVSVTTLAAAIQQPVDRVAAAVEDLRRQYDERNAGIEVREVAGGVRIYTRPAFAPQVEMFLQDGQRSRLTQAALETLAVIAYRQPVTRSRVSAIRGVNVDGVVRTLTTRGLIVEVGTDPETGGGLYRTTDLFLEKMGLQSLEELPSLAPLLPDIDGIETDEL